MPVIRWPILVMSGFVLLSALVPANAALISARSASSQGRASAAAGAFTLAKPAGTSVGDVMIASIGYRPCSNSSGGGCTTSITAPSGWTLIRLVEQKTGGGTGGYGLRLGIYRRVVNASDSGVASYTWTFGGAPAHNGAAGVLSSFINVDTANPVVIENGQATPSSRTHTTPNIGPLATNTLLVSTHAALSSATWTPPPGMTEILDWKSEAAISDLGMSLEINNEQRAAPGLTGTRTATFSNPPATDAGATHILALRPIQADPTISMARSGNLIVGSTASYALSIGNNGPNSISAANITVTDTLPAGLTYVSSSGAGWTCAAAGQVVTCTYSGGALASGGTLPVLTLNVSVVAGALWTNTATVSSGADGDNDLTNSTATDTWPTATTTLATGSDPAVTTIAPSALATDVNAFTLRTSNATEPISSVTVNLSTNSGIDTLAITDSANNVLGSVAFPASSGAVTIPVIGMTATTALQTFKVRVTPLVHVSMPAPPGGTYTITAPVIAWTGPAAHVGTDTTPNALSIDNESPISATATSATPGSQKMTLNWTTSSSADFATTSGSVVYRWLGASAGSEVPIEGSSPLVNESNGSATVACVISSAASTPLVKVDGSGGSAGCSTTPLSNGQQYTYKVFQKDTRGNYDALPTPLGSPVPATPGSFNAFETATAAGSITGAIQSKVAGNAFNLDLVALNTAGTAVESAFTGDVAVDLIANVASGVALGVDNCPASGTALAVGSRTITAGRSTANLPAVADSWRDVRVRMRYPATGAATITSCSRDNFAVKPAALSAIASHADWGSAGTTTTLANTGATGGVVHKAGQPFTLRVTGYNAGNVITGNYDGSPTATTTCVLPASGCVAGSLAPGMFSAASGTLTSNTASYSEVGAISATFVDTGYAAVDSGDTAASCAGFHVCSSAIDIGRFVPDHFDVSNNSAVFTPACGSFTYLGQSFGFGTQPLWTVTARNGAGATTRNYTGSLFKIGAATISGQAWSAATGTVAAVGTLPAVSVTDLGGGQGSLTFSVGVPASGGGLAFTRAQIAPFDASLTLAASVADSEGVARAGNPYQHSGIGFDDGNAATSSDAQMRFGRLRLANAVGSELLVLPVPLTAQYWNGQGWLGNTADNCTTISAPTLTFFSQTADNQLASAETAASFNATLVAGNGNLRFSAPGLGNFGFMELSVTAPAWLKFNWDGTDQGGDGDLLDDNPRARATFGKRRGSDKVIIRREMY